jgi:hypothetical protein
LRIVGDAGGEGKRLKDRGRTTLSYLEGKRRFLHGRGTCQEKESKRTLDCAGIFKQFMGARNRVGIELSYLPARNRGGIGLSYRSSRLHRLAEFIH